MKHYPNLPLKLACLGIVLAGATTARADFYPLEIDTNSYNCDIVIEADTCYTPLVPNRYTTATLRTDAPNDNRNVLFEIGLLPQQPTLGMPAPGSTLTSAADSTHVYQLAPSYASNNAIVLGAGLLAGTYSWTPANPSLTYSQLSFLACGYQPGSAFLCTVHFEDGTTESFNLTAPRWDVAGGEAYNAQGNLAAQAYTLSTSATCLFSVDCEVTNTTSAVTNISFVHAGTVVTTIMAVSGRRPSAGSFQPVAGSGYNADVVVENGVLGCLTGKDADPQWWRAVLTATLDNSTNDVTPGAGVFTFAEVGYDPGSVSTPGAPTNGMPRHGTVFTSRFDSRIQYQMPASYVGPNAWMMANDVPEATIVFATPTNVGSLSILHAMRAGVQPAWVITHHVDGVTETNEIYGVNTYGPTDVGAAWNTLLRVDVSRRGPFPWIYTPNPANSSPNSNLGDAVFALKHTNSPVDRVTITLPGGTNYAFAPTRFVAFAISGAPFSRVMPDRDPASLATLTTSNASFTASAIGENLTYQWQRGPLGSFTNLVNGARFSGVDTPTLAISDVQFSDAAYYRLVATSGPDWAASAAAQLFVYSGELDLAKPGDAVAIYGGSPVGASHGVEQAIDHFSRRYGNFGLNNGAPFRGPVGLVWTPAPNPITGNSSTIVHAIRLFCNGTITDTDPTSFVLEGSNDGGTTYRLIASNAIALPTTRNFGDTTHFLCDETGNNCLSGWPVPYQSWAEKVLPNTNAYQTYRFSVPTTRGSAADRVEYAEVQFLGIVNSNSPQAFTSQPWSTNVYYGGGVTLSSTFTGTGSAAYRWARRIGSGFAELTDGGNLSGSQTSSLTINPASFDDTADYICVATNELARATSGVARLTVLSTVPNIINAAAQISAIGDASAGFWMQGNPLSAIDNDLFVYQHGGSGLLAASGSPPFGGPAGLLITPSINGDGTTNATVLLGMRIFTAGLYYPERDPADYTLEGSADGGATFSVISSGTLSLPLARNAEYGWADPLATVLQEIRFPYHNQACSVYRLTFNHTRNDSLANCLQLAELQLLGVPAERIPVLTIEPGTVAGTITISTSVPAQLYSRTNLVEGEWVFERDLADTVTITPDPAVPEKFYLGVTTP